MEDEADAAEATRRKEAARTLVANERSKLAATYFNGLAVGLFLVGGVAPIFTYVFAAADSRPDLILIVFGGVICLTVSVGLHFLARLPLRGLKP